MDVNVLIGIALGTVCCLGLLGGVALLVVGTVMKTRFGINMGRAKCSECGVPAPPVRVPTNTYQTLWGGWTCEECGAELDKWGQPI